MNKDVYNKFKRIEACQSQLEEFCQEISSYIADLEHDLRMQNETIVDQVNTFNKETIKEIKNLKDKLKEIKRGA